jgi:two-component system, chemotaxis family, sensor kinase CheA
MTDLSLLQDFLAETSEHLEEMERNLLRLESDAHNKELLDDIFRSIHTIKGSSDYLGMVRIAELSHRLENLLDLMRLEKLPADQDTVDLLIDGRDRIASLITDLEESQTEITDIDDLLARLDAAVDQASSEAAAFKPAPAGGSDSDAAAAAPSQEPSEAPQEMTAIEDENDEELLAIFLDQFEEGVKGLREGLGDRGAFAPELIDTALKHLSSLQSSANYMGYGSLCRLYEPWEKELRQLKEQFTADDAPALSTLAYWQKYLKPHLAALLELIPAQTRDLQRYLEDPDCQKERAANTGDQGGLDADARLFSDVSLDDILDEGDEADADEGQSTPAAVCMEEPELSLDLEAVPKEETAVSEGEPLDAHADPQDDAFEPPSSPPDEELLADFVEEAREHLEEMESRLLELEESPDNADLLNDIFRCVHTVKGSADYIGLVGITQLSHQLESFLDHLRLGHRPMDNEVLEVLMAAGDQIRDMITALAEDGSLMQASEDMLYRLEVACRSVDPEAGPPETDTPEDAATDAATDLAADEALHTEGAADVPATPVTYIEENDEELLEIFLQQLRGELAALIELVDQEEDLNEATLKSCQTYLQNLNASANYMGYTELMQAYAQWEHQLDSQLAAIGEGAPDQGTALQSKTWLHECLLPFVKSIAGFFPQAERLADLWSHLDAPLSESIGAETQAEPTDPALLAQLGSAFDAMLQSPPTTEAHIPEGIESELFSAADTAAGIAADAAAEAIAEANKSEIATGTSAEIDTPLGNSRGVATPDAEKAAEHQSGPHQSDVKDHFSSTDSLSSRSPQMQTAAAPAADVTPPTKEAPASASAAGSQGSTAKRMLHQSIRVDASKIDALMNQVGELVVNRAFFSQLCNEMRELQHYLKQSKHIDKREFKQVSGLTFRISEATVALGRVANELQEGVMRVRMLPIAQLFNRYPRLVHDLARSSGKKVNLKLRGEDTELDKMVIERIADPLVHIIRNAVDHGLETPEERLGKGKPETGTLELNAYHESNHVVIEIDDDGRGVNLERIKTKAIEKGLIGESAASQLSEREIINLILIPGFSTADKITHTSGRGVGMDVVKKNIEKLNGTLEVDTIPGRSTRIRIKIPLTLAIIPALLVRVLDELFTIPLSVVDETLRVFKEEISVIEGVDVMYLRDETIPLIRLREVFNMDTGSEMAEKFFVVIVNTGEKRVGLIVDHMLGQEEVVIKPLEDYLQENSGFSGATILGDGQISLILDVYELIKLSTNKQARRQIS